MKPGRPHRQRDCPERDSPKPVCLDQACADQAPAPRTLAYDWLHDFYKSGLSPIVHAAGIISGNAYGGCRFQPTCSEYAALALAQHGPVRGLWLTLTRLLRCHPFARGGWDPVPIPVPITDASPPEAPPKGTIEAAQSTHDHV